MGTRVDSCGIELGVASQLSAAPVTPETPFRIGVLGDFSGRGTKYSHDVSADLSRRKPIVVDRDNIDDVLARLHVDVNVSGLEGDSQSLLLPLRELEDFHPDRLYEQLPAFARLKELRRQLLNPSTFDRAAQEVRAWNVAQDERGRDEPSESDVGKTEHSAPISDDNLLELTLQETDRTGAPPAEGPTLLKYVDEMIRSAIEPHCLPKVDADQGELIACVDAATSSVMRSVLHHPGFRSLEAIWNGIQFFVRRLSDDRQVKIYLIDVTKDELAADLHGGLESSGIYRLLVEQSVGTFGGEPWAVLAINDTIQATPDDLRLAESLAGLGASAGAPVLANVSPGLLGCGSLADTPDPDEWTLDVPADVRDGWDQLRSHPHAQWLGLVLPRFLLRPPYSRTSRPIDAFDFEELSSPTQHESYLWGNPAIACAHLLAETFIRSGWNMQPGLVQEVDRMPIYTYEADGESVAKPSAEALLTDRAIGRIHESGLMALATIKNSDRIRLVQWHSVAAPARPLAGRWD